MFTKSFKSLRRFSGHAFFLLLFCTLAGRTVEAQTTPPVTASVTTTLASPSGVTIGGVLETNLDKNGNWIVSDWINGGLYEYPAGGGAPITLAPLGTTAGNQSYQNNNVVFDANNNMMMNGNFNNCLLLFPYNPATKSWTGLSTLTTGNPASGLCGTAPYSFAQYGLITPIAPQANNYFQPWGTALLPGNVLVIGDQGGKFIFTLPVIEVGVPSCSNGACSPTATPGSNNASAATPILLSMTKRPNTVAADKFGNIYFTEDTSGLPGAYMIPAGDTAIPSDTDSRIVRIDPTLANVTGVATDANGNVYVGDSKAGVYMIPNPSGTPNTAAVASDNAARCRRRQRRCRAWADLCSNDQQCLCDGELQLRAAGGNGRWHAHITTITRHLYLRHGRDTGIDRDPGGRSNEARLHHRIRRNLQNRHRVRRGEHLQRERNTKSECGGRRIGQLLMLDGSGNVLASMPLSGVGNGPAVQLSPGYVGTIGSGSLRPARLPSMQARTSISRTPGSAQ